MHKDAINDAINAKRRHEKYFKDTLPVTANTNIDSKRQRRRCTGILIFT